MPGGPDPELFHAGARDLRTASTRAAWPTACRGNVAVNPHVGLLFIDFRAKRPSRPRVNGTASVDPDDPLLASFPGAQLVERSRDVPRAGAAAPVPAWKRAAWACDVLPAGDQAGRS